MIISVPDPEVIQHIEEPESKSPKLEIKMLIGEERKGWLNFTTGMEKCSEKFNRPVPDQATVNIDIMLLILHQEPPECQKWLTTITFTL